MMIFLSSRLEIPSEESTLFISEREPFKVVIVEALIIPVVFSSRVLSKEASIEESEIVIISLPKPFIPEDT